MLRCLGGALGALGGPLERPEAQGRSGVSEKGSRGSWDCLGPNPKPFLLGSKYVRKIKCFRAWAIFDEMKGLSGLRCFCKVFSDVPSAEQGGEFIGTIHRN